MTCICVTCGHARPFTGSGKCPECEAHKLQELQNAFQESLWRLEQFRNQNIVVMPDYQDEKVGI